MIPIDVGNATRLVLARITRDFACASARGHVAYHIYQDALGHWRWYLRSDDHRKIATSGGSYPDKESCLAAVTLVMGANIDTPVFED